MKKSLPRRKFTLFETEARLAGFSRIVGVDEAGRGPLAGPIVAACCQLDEGVFIKGVNDCKLLTPLEREKVVSKLKGHSGVRIGIGIVDHETIDRINIVQATLLAMRQALEQLPEKPDYILVDGPLPLSYQEILVKKIITGDRLSLSIAAASNVAKVTRDDLMNQWHQKYSEYRFDKHKGYGTQEHRDILARLGPSPIHRMSFLKKILPEESFDEELIPIN